MTAKAPVDACPYGKVCYKGVTLTFGGWVDLTDIYRTRLASDTGLVYNFIPFAQSKNFFIPESRFSARQSRFSALAEGNVDPDTHLAGYGEIDFEGAAQTASSVATNSFNPRMRELSLRIDRTDLGFHVLAGQSWSLNAPSKVGLDPIGVDAPGVIDFEIRAGFLAARQPGIRVWQQIGPEIMIGASAENPQTAFFGGNTPAVGPQGVLNPNLLVNLSGPCGSFFNNANNVSLNQVPDVTVKAAWDPRLGPYQLHIEAWGLYRQFFNRFNFANHTDDTDSFGGHINAELVPKTLELQVYGANGALGRFTATPFPARGREKSRRLLPKLRVRATEVGRSGILADLDDAAADGAGAGKMLEQRLAVRATDGTGEFREVLVEGAEHLQHGLFVGEEHVAPHCGIGGRDAGEIAKAAGGEFYHFGRGDLRQLVGGADDGVGDQMRQMAGDREHEIMVVRRHGLDPGAHRSPERPQFLCRGRIGALRRRQDAPAIDEKLGKAGIGAGVLGAGYRMCRHEMDVSGQMRSHLAHHRALDRADVGDDGTLCEMRADFLGDLAAGPDGDAENDEVGVFRRLDIGRNHGIDDAELLHPCPRFLRARSGDDLTDEALRPCRARDRAADQAEADQRQTLECRLSVHFAAMNSRRPSTTRRLASSVPTVMRSACGSL